MLQCELLKRVRVLGRVAAWAEVVAAAVARVRLHVAGVEADPYALWLCGRADQSLPFGTQWVSQLDLGDRMIIEGNDDAVVASREDLHTARA